MVKAGRTGMVVGLLPVMVFLALAFIEIDLPGLNMDEACIDSYVVKIIDSSKTIDRPTFNLPDNILDRHGRFPLTGGIYVGLTAAYLGAPYYSVFGMNLFSLRIYHTLYGAATVFLVFLILDRIASRRIAIWGSLLLAVDAGFLVAYRCQGWNVTAHMPLFLGAIFLALPQGNDVQPISGKRAFAIGILYGLACYGYFVYLLFAPPLVLALLLTGREQLTRKAILSGAAGCLLGYMPLLYALLSIAKRAPALIPTFAARAGSDLDLHTRLTHMLSAIRATFSDVSMPQMIAGPYPVPFSDAKVYLWLLLAACLPTVWYFKGQSRSVRLLAVCILMLVCYCVELLQFGNQVCVHHVMVILPLAYIALAVFVQILMTGSASRRPPTKDRWAHVVGGSVIAACTLLLAPMNLSQHCAMTRQLVRTGGIGIYSDAICVLADDLKMNHLDDMIVYCDWGYMLPCHILTRGELRFAFDVGGTDEEMDGKFTNLFATHSRLTFVLPKMRETAVFWPRPVADIRAGVLRAAEKAGFDRQSCKTFLQRDGVPVVETITFVKNTTEG